MSKPSVRFVALSAIIAGTATDSIVAEIKSKCESKKDDAAIKKDINWYRSHAKKEELIDSEGFATDKGEEWVTNGGKKPVDPKVQAERDAKKQAAEEKKAAAKLEREEKAKKKAAEKASKKESSPAKTPATSTKDADKKKETGKSSDKPTPRKPSKKPAAVAAAEQKAAQEDDL